MNPTIVTDQPPTLSRRLTVFLHAVLFVLGFSFVFIFGWGGATTLLGQFIGQYKRELAKVAGIVVILFGLVTLRVIKVPWLYYDTRPQLKTGGRGGWWPSALMGVVFAAGWTPCVGVTLGAILTLGFSQGKASQAMVLSSGYALGLGLPFLLIGLGMDRAGDFLRRFRKHLHTMELITGFFLIVMGVVMLFGQLNVLAIWAQKTGLLLDVPLGASAVPSYFIAILAGALSFLSPCVLPLVPAYMGYLGGHAIGGVRTTPEG